MISIQTNYASMVGQQNMSTNQIFQTKTIEALTSGYRINSSGDDAAGLAVANGYRSNVAELTQGVINANSAVSQLQIMDGGLNNISNILDRLKTLASESSSSTFTGDRTTLNNEFQSLLSEINRQSSNVGLNTGGANATLLTVYIGGGNVQSNSQVNVDLTGNAVDVTGLGLNGQNLLTAGTDVATGNAVNLNTATTLLTGHSTGSYQAFNFNTAAGSFAVTVSSTSSAGISVADALSQLNNKLNGHGLTATVDTANGDLMISGSTAFSMAAAGAVTANAGGNGAAAGAVVTAASTVSSNTANYGVADQAFTGIVTGDEQNVSFTSGGQTVSFQLTAGNAGSISTAVQTLNQQLASLGISAVQDAAGTGITLEGTAAFSATVGTATNNGGAGPYGFTGSLSGATVNASTPTSTGSSTGNSLAAVTAVQSAVAVLGVVQGKVGAGENTLQYSISLAQSQITNFSSAEAQLRDADVAAEAANLTKAQVLQQASIAAMAQANSAPQAVLKLLQ